jgi:hypothetical protein
MVKVMVMVLQDLVDKGWGVGVVGDEQCTAPDKYLPEFGFEA